MWTIQTKLVTTEAGDGWAYRIEYRAVDADEGMEVQAWTPFTFIDEVGAMRAAVEHMATTEKV